MTTEIRDRQQKAVETKGKLNNHQQAFEAFYVRSTFGLDILKLKPEIGTAGQTLKQAENKHFMVFLLCTLKQAAKLA